MDTLSNHAVNHPANSMLMNRSRKMTLILNQMGDVPPVFYYTYTFYCLDAQYLISPKCRHTLWFIIKKHIWRHHSNNCI